LNRFKGLFGDTLVIVDDDDVDKDDVEEGGVDTLLLELVSMLESLSVEALDNCVDFLFFLDFVGRPNT